VNADPTGSGSGSAIKLRPSGVQISPAELMLLDDIYYFGKFPIGVSERETHAMTSDAAFKRQYSISMLL
jgi:hypothetical protein